MPEALQLPSQLPVRPAVSRRSSKDTLRPNTARGVRLEPAPALVTPDIDVDIALQTPASSLPTIAHLQPFYFPNITPLPPSLTPAVPAKPAPSARVPDENRRLLLRSYMVRSLPHSPPKPPPVPPPRSLPPVAPSVSNRHHLPPVHCVLARPSTQDECKPSSDSQPQQIAVDDGAKMASPCNKSIISTDCGMSSKFRCSVDSVAPGLHSPSVESPAERSPMSESSSQLYHSFLNFNSGAEYQSSVTIRIFGRYFQRPGPKDGKLTSFWLTTQIQPQELPIAVGETVEIFSPDDHSQRLVLHKAQITGLVYSKDPSWVSFTLMSPNSCPAVLLVPRSCVVLSRLERMRLLFWTRRFSPTRIPVYNAFPTPAVYAATQRKISYALCKTPLAFSKSEEAKLPEEAPLVSGVWSRFISSFLGCFCCSASITNGECPVPTPHT